jgi:hypothetical protein
MKCLFFLLLLGLLIIAACKKGSLPDAGGNTLIKTVLTIPGTRSVDSFVYNGQQLAEMICSGTNPSFGDTITLQYDVSGRLASWTQRNNGVGGLVTYQLSYNASGRIVKEIAVPQLSNYGYSDYSFAYDAKGQIIADTVFAQHLAGVPSVGIMAYDNWTYDDKGNAIADQGFNSTNTSLVGPPFAAGFTITYRYDDQVNPYYNAGIPFFSLFGFGPQLLSPNNQVSGESNSNSLPYTYSYAYFSNGRPRAQTIEVHGSGGPETQTTSYFYQ